MVFVPPVFPRPGARVWYDDQREVHRQIFASDEAVDYAFMGQDPDAADNRWLREACENQIPVIYFLGIAPGCYQAMIPTFIPGWDGKALKARIIFGVPDQRAEKVSGTFSRSAAGREGRLQVQKFGGSKDPGGTSQGVPRCALFLND